MMIRGLLEKAEIEEKKGRSMERDAQQMRAKATKLAHAAMAPLADESDPEREENEEEKPPSTAPSKKPQEARTGNAKARLSKGPVPDDEEARPRQRRRRRRQKWQSDGFCLRDWHVALPYGNPGGVRSVTTSISSPRRPNAGRK